MATTLCDVTVGVSTAVSVMPVLQSERQFSPAVDIRGCFTNTHDHCPGGEIFLCKGFTQATPTNHLCRTLIDKVTPTTRSRQSLIDKHRFGAIPRIRMRIEQNGLHDGAQFE